MLSTDDGNETLSSDVQFMNERAPIERTPSITVSVRIARLPLKASSATPTTFTRRPPISSVAGMTRSSGHVSPSARPAISTPPSTAIVTNLASTISFHCAKRSRASVS